MYGTRPSEQWKYVAEYVNTKHRFESSLLGISMRETHDATWSLWRRIQAELPSTLAPSSYTDLGEDKCSRLFLCTLDRAEPVFKLERATIAAVACFHLRYLDMFLRLVIVLDALKGDNR